MNTGRAHGLSQQVAFLHLAAQQTCQTSHEGNLSLRIQPVDALLELISPASDPPGCLASLPGQTEEHHPPVFGTAPSFHIALAEKGLETVADGGRGQVESRGKLSHGGLPVRPVEDANQNTRLKSGQPFPSGCADLFLACG